MCSDAGTLSLLTVLLQMYTVDEPTPADWVASLRNYRLHVHTRSYAGLVCSHQVSYLSHAIFYVTRFGSGLSYSIVYATLLVKLVFLICLNSGIYMTPAYQVDLISFHTH